MRERLKHLRGTAHDATFTIPQRFEGVCPVDRLGVLPRASRKLLETLFHTRQCAKFLSQASDPRLQGNDLAGVGGQSGTDVIQPRLDLGNALGLEVVEQQELRRRAIGDAFDLVLAVDVGAKHASSLERDVRRLSIRSQDERLLTCRSADDVGQAVLRLDDDLDAATRQVALDERLDAPAFGRLLLAAGQRIERIPNELERRRLARPPSADEAVQPVRELEARAVEKAPDDGDGTNAMGRALFDGRFLCRDHSGVPLLRWICGFFMFDAGQQCSEC